MPLAYQIDSGAGLVTITGDYALPPEWRVVLDQVRRDPAFRPGLAFLRDLRESRHPVDAAAVEGIIAVVRELWNTLGVRRAAMVTRARVDIPAVMAHALAESEGIPLRTFTHIEEALAWLAEE